MKFIDVLNVLSFETSADLALEMAKSAELWC